ncbi:DUF4367 domain-containing protein [Paenibacillus sp. Marseille-Q4541]|uniref:DUF4367 domain-containing protein n=1 Tax=Paenibacillus sp. Marseille-Q4541 TaxID=2831522 RepID=UPI001BAC14E6|nr:DUF4367 domain-containing protein [Paenibacillus sp. Marseille-Q4541]
MDENSNLSADDNVLHAIRLVQSGNIDAYITIVQTYEQKIFMYCWRLLGNREDAEDVEKRKVKVLYMEYKGKNPHHVIKWVDESSGVYYHINDTEKSKLSKQELLKIAEKFVR